MYVVFNEYELDGEFCPDKAGADVGTCLKAHGVSKLSKACQEYISLHDTCASDIQ